MPLRSFLHLFSRFAQLGLQASFATCIAAVTMHASGQKSPGAEVYPDSRLDVYAGYGYLHPFNSGINGYVYQPLEHPNVTVSITGWFTHYLGAQVEGSYFPGDGEHRGYLPSCTSTTCDQLLYTAQAGPVFRMPFGRFVPFAHALAGGERSNGPAAQNLKWGWGATAGAGVDYILPLLNRSLAIRPIQADYHVAEVDHAASAAPDGVLGGTGLMNALKLSAGLVLRFGEKSDTQPLMLGCTALPVSVHAGEAVTVNGSTLYLDPKRPAHYTWQSNGGTLNPQDATVTVNTTGMTPGEYTVEGHVSQGSKAREQASCTAPFTVRPAEPPTVTCIATPSTAPSGTTISISTTGTSPQNRPLTYSYSTTAGQITGTGATAKLTTDGLGSATVIVTCNAVDDLGQSGTWTTSVTLGNPVLPTIPETQALCTISFNRDRRRPVRVDNESKACLDDIALTLAQQSEARLIVIGDTSPDEKPEAAAQRALNERQYLTDEKGLDRTRIEVRVGDTSGRTVRNVLVPSGATYNDSNTQTFDEGAISRPGQAYGSRSVRSRHPTPRHSNPKPHSSAPLPPYTGPSQ